MSAVLRGLRRKIIELDDIKSDVRRKELAHAIKDDIAAVDLSTLSELGVAELYGICFQTTPPSILAYLRNANPEQDAATTPALLEALVVAVDICPDRSMLAAHANAVVDCCLGFISKFKHSAFKKATEAGAELIAQLLSRQVQLDPRRVETLFKSLTLLLDSKREKNEDKRTLFELGGALCRHFPTEADRLINVRQLMNLLVAELRKNVNSMYNTPTLTVVVSNVRGLCGLLYHFSHLCEGAGNNSLEAIFNMTKVWLNPNVQLKRFGPVRAILLLYSEHAALFAEHLLKEYSLIYGWLCHWTMQTEKELKKAAYMATDAFLEQVAERFPDVLRKNRSDADAMLQYFSSHFERTLFARSSVETFSMKSVSAAVKGLGKLARAVRLINGDDAVNELLQKVAERADQIFIESQEPIENRIFYLPQFIDSLSLILRCVTSVEEEFWLCVERLQLLYFHHFPIVDFKQHYRSALVTYQLLVAALPHRPSFVDHLIRQTLLRIASTPVGGNEATVSVTDYLPLWAHLSGRSTDDRLDKSEREHLCALIFHATVSGVVSIVESLDLTIGKSEDESIVLSNAAARSDFLVFGNLVDFFCAFLDQSDGQLFAGWVWPLSQKFVLLAARFPFASGLYRMLSSTVTLARRSGYFDSTLDSDVRQCQHVLSQFADEALCRVGSLKDNHLFGVLHFILALPSQMIADKVDSVAVALTIALKLGHSYLPLAATCLDALELWIGVLDKSKRDQLCAALLPVLDDYLRTESTTNEERNSLEANKRRGANATKEAQNARQRGRLARQSTDDVQVVKLAELRQRIALFLGNIGGCLNKFVLAGTADETIKAAIAWDTYKHLPFDVPFSDAKVRIELDRFLPHICELATKSGNRQCKTAAAECLHSIVVYALGRHGSLTNQEQDKQPMNKLYRLLFPYLLRLCCDADQVPMQLFRPLVTQIIHWFSANQSYENRETVALIDSLMEAIIDDSDASLREYAANCIDEFLKWTIKQNAARAQKEAMRNNAKSVMKRVCNFAEHPDPLKRLGAAVAFNAFYRTLRESAELVDEFALDLLAVYFRSLSMAHDDSESAGTVEQCSLSIAHLQRIVLARDGQKSPYFDRLMTASNSRRVPKGWSEATVRGALAWLVGQIARPEAEFRRKAWEFVLASCRLIGGPLKATLDKLAGFESVSDWVTKFEKSLPPAPRTTQLSVEWFEALEATADCFLMFLNSGYSAKLTPVLSCSRILIPAVVTFLRMYVIGAHGGENDDDEWLLGINASQRTKFNKIKCTVVVRILSLVQTVVSLGSTEGSLNQVAPELWTDVLWHSVVRICANPASVGFDMTDKNVLLNLPLVIKETCRIFAQKLPPNISAQCQKSIDSQLQKQFPLDESVLDLFAVDGVASSDQVSLALSREEAYFMLADLKLTTFPLDPERLWRRLIAACFNSRSNIVQFPPVTNDLMNKLIAAAVRFGLQTNSIVAAICDQSRVVSQTSNDSDATVTKGQAICQRFVSPLAEAFASAPREFFDSLLNASDLTTTIDTVVQFLDHLGKNDRLRQRFGKRVNEAIASRWNLIERASPMICCRLLMKMVLVNSEFATISCTFSDETKKTICHIPDNFAAIFNKFCLILVDRSITLSDKNKALMLLGVFALLPNASENAKVETFANQLKNSLETFVSNDLPIVSTEFAEGTAECSCYLSTMQLLLRALTLSNSSILLHVLVSILCREKAHIARDEISYLLNRYARRMSPSVFSKQLQVPLLVVLNESLVGNSGEQLRLNTLDRVLLPMLDGLSSEHLVVFFIDQVFQLTAALASPILTDTALTTKIGCYKLLQVMYERLDVSVLKGAINKRYAPNDSDTALLRELVRCSKLARCQFADELSVRKWQYRCAAQNCLMAVVCKTQTNPEKVVNFFKEYLFPTDVWRWLTDESHSYSFDTEFEQLPQRQKMLLRLRKAMRQGTDADLMVPMSQGNNTLGFLSSQVLASSSVHSQVSSTSQYDFTASDSQDATGMSKTPRTTPTNGDRDDTADDDDEGEVLAMEMDELNDHPCMQSIVAAMRHFCQMGDGVFDKTGTRDPPQWMQGLWEQLESPKASVNVKLLVWRLVGHLEQEFRPYAKRWLPPLIKSLSDQTLGGPGLHYFRVDTLVSCLSWAPTATPSAAVMHDASRLLAFMIDRAAHENSVVLARNVRLVQLMCECWKGLSYRQPYLSEQLIIGSKNSDTVTPVTVAALQLTAVLIQNDIDPLAAFDADQEAYDDKVNKFYDTLLPVYFVHKSSKVRISAAELVGVAFAFYSRNGIDPMGAFPSVKQHVVAVKRIEESRFLRILAAISRHYPKFVAPFKTDVCSLLAKVHGDYKTVCLELACALAADRDAGELRELPLPAVRQMMTKSTDPAVRECALRLIKLMTNGKLSTEMIADLVPDIVSFVDYHHVPCRSAMIDTCIVLYDEHKNEAATNEHSAKILSLTKDCLLRCLSDSDAALKQKVCNFWSHESRLAGDLTGRAIGLLQLAFSSSSDRQFLSDATYLLLERCAKSPDFERPLFDNPLSRCDFQNIEVVTNWRRRNEAWQTPVFAMTQKPTGAMSQLPSTLAGVSGLETMHTQRDGDQHRLRATQAGDGALKFEQTLTQGQHFDWLSGNTYDENTLSADSQVGRFGEQIIAGAGGQRSVGKRKLRPIDARFGRKLGLNQSTAVHTDSDTIDELRRMKRRILKDRKKTSDLYAKSGMRIRQSRHLAKKEERAASGQTVQLYRTYRYGDFPDVQIACRAVVAPLQALAKCDAHIAALLFESLLDGVHQQAVEAADDDWRPRLKAAIEDVLRQSFVYGPVVSALLSFCHGRAGDLLIEPTLVASAGIGSNQQMAAVAVLEHYLEVRLWDRGAPTGKRRRPNDPRSDDDESKIWLELVKVYKSIGDTDMVRGVFEKKLNCLASTKLGLEAEFRHDYDTAIDIYSQALKEMDQQDGLQSDFEFSEQQLVEESRLKCLDTLGDWSSITRIVGQMVDAGDGQSDAIDFDGVWTMTEEDSSSTLQERKKMCLSYLMRSNVRLVLQLNGLEQTLRQHVQKFVDAERRWETDDEKRSFLETRFATDMALRSFAWQLNDEAAGHLATALNNFLVEWPQMPKMLDSSRHSLLATLQPIAHAFSYLNFVKHPSNFDNLSSLSTLCARWRDAAVDDLSELTRWDDVVSSRCWFIMNISERMKKTVNEQAVYETALPAEIRDRLRYASAASTAGCYSLAEDQMKAARKLLKALNDKQLSADWTHTYARVHLSSAVGHADRLSKVVEQVGKAAELLSVRQSQYPGDEETVRLMGIACWRLAERFLVLDHDDWKELSEETKITAIHLAGLANDEQISFGRITSGLLNRADSCLQRAADARIDDSAVMTFANFCDFYINAKRDSDEQGKKSASLRTKRDAADYAQSLVGALFDAMRMGSAEARQLFPKLLNVIETFPDCRSTFADRAKTVPTWMFLGWLNQIIAVLDSPSATTLHDIVRRLSEEYPQAVFYPFNVSRKQWTLTDSVRKAFVEKLDDKFETMTLLKTLIKAVDLLCPPELLIKAFSAELTLAQAQSVSPSTLAELRSKTDELCRDLFVAHDECGLADYEAAQPGKFWRDFCKNHYPLFRKEFGKKGANIGDLLAKKQARSKLNSLQAHMKTDSTLEVPPAKLHEYSEWLGNFNAADYETELEIPGQYVGDKKPDVSMHVKICNFDERVAVFRSLAKPKAITIRGNDGHEYRYLVKGGEDLRQDERIEQLFGVINGLLDADVECSKRHLRIQTYRVVPLSSRLGLLQFVPNVKSLAEFLNEQMNADERAYHKNAAHMWKKVYDKECINLTADCAFGSAFEESVQKYSPDKAAECLRRARNIFRPNLLHSGLQQLCWDATGAALVQSEMTRSYAVLCVAHYLLGIGDRHLNNMMIDVTTGRMVGIDFGYAFGIGLLLDVPELVPFRLTRQFVVAMGPLGVDGRFTSAVRLCLRALRNNKQLLLNTMDVFVKEPSMNWTDQARRDRLRGNAPVEADSDDSWYPKQKLDIAAMKLSGRNPVLITCEELKQGKLKRKSAVLDRLNMILCGRNEKTWNEKKDMASPRGFPNDLTVDQQADCLVQLAADDAVVSRIYFGWEPWL